jgi:tetratricopeptide (TPR) repeat protein
MDRLAVLRGFLRDDPDDPFTRFAIASEHVKRGEDENARAAFEELRRDRPDYVGTYYHLGMLHARSGRLAEAAETFRAGVEQATAQGDSHASAELRAALLELDGVAGVDADA